jgi:crotonobetainyl-CoA:carnitine CoA-transferase CaiB-like acyl-CoA transferase
VVHGRDVAFAPVLDFAEALRQPHVAGRMLIEADGHHRFGSPVVFGRAAG